MDAVFRAIGELNVDMRAALLLRDVVGLSYNEIAEALEISLATTKWRIFKARELTAARLVAEGVLTPPSTATSLAGLSFRARARAARRGGAGVRRPLMSDCACSIGYSVRMKRAHSPSPSSSSQAARGSRSRG